MKRQRFDAREMVRWLVSDDSPADAEVVRKSTAPVWWWRKYVEATRAANRGNAESEAQGYLAALVLLAAAVDGQVPTIEADERLAGNLRRVRAAGDVLRAATSLEEAELALEDLLVAPLAAFELSDEATAELLATLHSALDAETSPPDLLGAVLSEGPGQPSSESTTRTAAELAYLMARLGAPVAPCSIYDPASGEGRLLAECFRVAVDGHEGRVKIVAQETDVDALRMARTTLLLAGADAEFGEPRLDSIKDDQFADLRADLVVVDTPIVSGTTSQSGHKRGDVFGHGPEQWLEHATQHGAPSGRAVIVLPGHAITKVYSARRRPSADLVEKLRGLVEEGRVESVIALPRRLRPDINGPVTIWTIDTEPVGSGRVLVVRPEAEKARLPTKRSAKNDLPFDVRDLTALVQRWRSEPFDGLETAGDVRAEPFELDAAWGAVADAVQMLDDEGGRPELRTPRPAPDPVRLDSRQELHFDEIIDALGDQIAQLSRDDPAAYDKLRRNVEALRGEHD